MIKAIRRKANKEDGQSVVEFALTLPLMLLILCGILDFGWIYANQYKTEYAAYTAARYASLNVENESSAELTRKTTERAVSNLYGTGAGASVDLNIGSENIEVTVNYPIKTLTFVAGTIFGDYYTASSTCVTGY